MRRHAWALLRPSRLQALWACSAGPAGLRGTAALDAPSPHMS